MTAFGQERTSTYFPSSTLGKTKKAQTMEDERTSPDGQHRAKWYGGGELWMSGPEWGFLEIDGRTPFRGALPEFRWSTDSAYFAFVYIHDEHVTTRQGIEGVSFKIRIVRLCDGQVRHVTASRDLLPVALTEFDSHHLTFVVANRSHTAILGQLNWTEPNIKTPA